MNKVRSARGEIVNFDLLKIKQQIATAPKPVVVQARESFVDQRNRRRSRRVTPPVTPAVAPLEQETNNHTDNDNGDQDGNPASTE
jgi:hypothetical protein